MIIRLLGLIAEERLDGEGQKHQGLASNTVIV